MLKKLLAWVQDNWRDLLSSDVAASAEHEICKQNLQRSIFIAYLLLIYEPISLTLMLTGFTDTFTLWYTIPTAVLLLVSALFLFYTKVLRKQAEISDKHSDMAVLMFFLTISLSLSALVVGDVTQYGQNYLNYLLALCLIAIVPMFRFRRFVPLLLFPFLAETVSAQHSLHIGFTIEPVALFLFSTIAGAWMSHNAVESIVNNLEVQRTAEQLRINEKNYRMVLNQSGKDFLFLDIVGRTILFPRSSAERFGIPEFLDNIPESLLSLGILYDDSAASILNISDSAFSGMPSERTLIKCHTKSEPEKPLWFSISYTSVFDSNIMPVSALVICEDMTEQHEKEMAYKRLSQMNKELITSGTVSIEYNLDERTYEHVYYAQLNDDIIAALSSPASTEEYLTEKLLSPDEADAFKLFIDPLRLANDFHRGLVSNSAIYKLRGKDEENRDFLKLAVQMIQDPYTGNIKVFITAAKVSNEEQRAFQMQRDIDRLKSELESSRIRAMINQMQPHFLYNALSAIQTIIKSDPDRAYNLIYDFTIHLRASIKALSSDQPIPFSEELRNIKAYLNIEQMRFGDGLTVNYDIECDDFMIVPLSIQPLAENAARHGIWSSGSEVGTITIRSREETEYFVVEVEDDGMGFDVDKVLKGVNNSYGLQNLIFRLKHLIGAEVVINSTIGVGTLVKVQIPKNTLDDVPRLE